MLLLFFPESPNPQLSPVAQQGLPKRVLLQGIAPTDMVTLLEITLNEGIEAPVKTSSTAIVCERPQMTWD